MIECALSHDANTQAVCEIFAAGRGPLYDYLRFNAQSAEQVPFYYLKLVREGKDDLRAGRPLRLSAEQVEIAFRAILQHEPSAELVEQLLSTCDGHKQLLAQLLGSPRFIERLPRLLSQAFPQLRRLWHVHIPKTAGTSFFTAAVNSGWGYINFNLLAAASNMQQVANALRFGPESRNRLIISGHWHLWRHMHDIEPADSVVTFVRDPLDAMVSEFNFAVDVVNQCSHVHSAHPSVMLDRGLDPASFEKSYRQGFFVANVQCSYLAQDFHCHSALANLGRFNAALLPSHAVDYATRKYLAVASLRRENVSQKHLALRDLPLSLREELLLRSGQDALLNDVARRRFQEQC
jgi:hypothetical protein